MTVTIRLTVPLEEAHRRLSRAMSNYGPLLDEMGAVLTHHSQRAFQDQAFGEFSWPARYWGKGNPFLNVAGALTDLSSGPRVAGNRFDPRPALIDRGGLQSSVTWRVLGDRELEYGSPRDYAKIHQEGGESSIPIDDQLRQNVSDWLDLSGNDVYLDRLGFVFQSSEYRFKVNRRPFVGVTDQGREDLIAALEEYLRDALENGENG